MNEHDEIIKELAVKYGIAVTNNDPILIVETLHRLLVEDFAKNQKEMMDRYKEDLEALLKRWGDDARNKAETILNKSLAASEEMMTKAAEDGAAVTAAILNKEIADNLGAVRGIRGLVIANVIACALTLAAAFLVLWVKR